MPTITVKGLDEITRSFKEFQFSGKNIQKRFLKLIADNTIELARQLSPNDTGELANSWKIVSQSRDTIEVGTDFVDLVLMLSNGTSPHEIYPNKANVLRFEINGQEVFASKVMHPGTKAIPFIDQIRKIIHANVMNTLNIALAENHEFFKKLSVGGQGRRFQQVGRTSAGFKGGVSFAGRSTLIRPGTGRKQLKRRLSLRRRRGMTINKNEVRMTIG